MPELSDPLGAPYIIKPDDWVNQYKASGYAPGTLSLLPQMTAITQAGTSLIDNAYKNATELAQAQANLKYTQARTDSVQQDIDFAGRTADLRVDALKQENAQRQQSFDQNAAMFPMVQQKTQNELDLQKQTNAATERDLQANSEAVALVPQATSELPNPDDPNYTDERDAWRLKYSKLFSNPVTAKRMQDEYTSVDSIYQGKASTLEANEKRKELIDLQTNGYIPKVLNPDALIKSPTVNETMTRGRMLQSRDQIANIAAQLPDNDPNKERLNSMLQEIDGYTASDTAVQDVERGKAANIFDTNGRLTGAAQGAVTAAVNYAAAYAKLLQKPEGAVEFGLGTPNKKGEYPSKMTIKGTPQDVMGLANQFGLQPAGQPATVSKPGTTAPPMTPGMKNAYNDPRIKDLTDQLARKQITRAQYLDELHKLPEPAATPAPTPPSSASKPPPDKPHGTTSAGNAAGAGAQPVSYTGEEGARLPTSNNDYAAPRGAPDVAGIDSNVWQNVMSEEGAEFGLDPGTHHMSVFGLWQGTPDVEGSAYDVARQYGPRSPQAYQAVTHAWVDKFLGQSQPWRLASPGMQEMVIADSQHKGGQASRDIIDQMGGWNAVNSMDPTEAIRTYSRLREGLWKGNQGRVAREQAWALRYNDVLSNRQAQVGQLSA